MLEWLNATLETSVQPAWDMVLVRLFLASILGGAAAGIYAWTHRRDDTFSVNFLTTLVLLSLLIATVTQVIGDNLARAFGLVGVLAIVRFRTVVEDTRDTAFVMLAVIVGMAVGAGYPRLGVAALGFAAISAVLLQPRRVNTDLLAPYWSLTVRVGIGSGRESALNEALAKHVTESHLLSTATGRQGAALDLSYKVRLQPAATPTEIVGELNRLDGVQSVELRRL